MFKCIRSEKELDALPSGVRLRKTPSEDKPEYSFGVPLGEKVLVKGPVISSETNSDTLYLELADGSGFVPIDLGLGPHFEVGQSAPFSYRVHEQPRVTARTPLANAPLNLNCLHTKRCSHTRF